MSEMKALKEAFVDDVDRIVEAQSMGDALVENDSIILAATKAYAKSLLVFSGLAFAAATLVGLYKLAMKARSGMIKQATHSDAFLVMSPAERQRLIATTYKNLFKTMTPNKLEVGSTNDGRYLFKESYSLSMRQCAKLTWKEMSESGGYADFSLADAMLLSNGLAQESLRDATAMKVAFMSLSDKSKLKIMKDIAKENIVSYVDGAPSSIKYAGSDVMTEGAGNDVKFIFIMYMK
jgi:hypothetical protein